MRRFHHLWNSVFVHSHHLDSTSPCSPQSSLNFGTIIDDIHHCFLYLLKLHDIPIIWGPILWQRSIAVFCFFFSGAGPPKSHVLAVLFGGCYSLPMVVTDPSMMGRFFDALLPISRCSSHPSNYNTWEWKPVQTYQNMDQTHGMCWYVWYLMVTHWSYYQGW